LSLPLASGESPSLPKIGVLTPRGKRITLAPTPFQELFHRSSTPPRPSARPAPVVRICIKNYPAYLQVFLCGAKVFARLSQFAAPAIVSLALCRVVSHLNRAVNSSRPEGIRGSSTVGTSLFQKNELTSGNPRPCVGLLRCAGWEDVSRVCDLSVGGLFLSTPVPRQLGERARLDFLVPEGQIAPRPLSSIVFQWRPGLEIHGDHRPGLPEPRSVNEQGCQFHASPSTEVALRPQFVSFRIYCRSLPQSEVLPIYRPESARVSCPPPPQNPARSKSANKMCYVLF